MFVANEDTLNDFLNHLPLNFTEREQKLRHSGSDSLFQKWMQ